MDLNLPRIPYKEDKLFGLLFLICLVVPLVFDMATYENFEVIKFGLLLLLCGGLLLVLRSRFSAKAYGNRLFFYASLGFWSWAVIATLFSWDKNFSIFGFYPRFTNNLLFYTLWVIFLLALSFLERIKLDFLLKVLVFCGGLAALWGLVQAMGIGYYTGLTTDFFNRGAPSFLGNPNFTTMFLAATLPLALGLLYLAKGLKGKIYYILNSFLQLFALIIFASRGAIIGALAGLLSAVLLTVFFKKTGLRFLLVLGVAIICGIVINQGFLKVVRPAEFISVVKLNDVNIQNRVGVWKLSLGSLARRPLLGVGLGNFQLMFEHDRQGPIVNAGFFDDAHNLPLELAVTGGIPLLLFFLLMSLAGVLSAFRRLWMFGFDAKLIAILSALVAWFTASLFNPLVIPVYILLAVLLSSCFSEQVGQPVPPAFNSRPVKAVGLTLAVVFLLYGCLFLTAEHLFLGGMQAYGQKNFGQAYRLSKVAAELNPFNRLYYMYAAAGAIRSNQSAETTSYLMDKVITVNPGLAHSYAEEGSLYYLLYYQTRNPDYARQVLNYFGRAIAMDPYLSGNYFLLGQYNLAFGHVDEAISQTLKGLKLTPDSFESWMFLAKLYQIKNDKTLFLQATAKAQELQPDNIKLVLLLGQLKQGVPLQKLPLNVNLVVGNLD